MGERSIKLRPLRTARCLLGTLVVRRLFPRLLVLFSKLPLIVHVVLLGDDRIGGHQIDAAVRRPAVGVERLPKGCGMSGGGSESQEIGLVVHIVLSRHDRISCHEADFASSGWDIRIDGHSVGNHCANGVIRRLQQRNDLFHRRHARDDPFGCAGAPHNASRAGVRRPIAPCTSPAQMGSAFRQSREGVPEP